jgi:hypothetical protein
MPRKIAIVSLLLLVALVCVLWYNLATWTPQAAEKGKIRTAVKTATGIAAGQSEKQYNAMNAGFQKAGDADPRKGRDLIIERASVANEWRKNYEEGLATADGKTIRQTPLFVDATNPQPQGHITFVGPLMIHGVTGYVESRVSSGNYASGPDGIPKPDEKIVLPLDDNNLYNALIGRVCKSTADPTKPDCTPWFFVGSSGKVLCPAMIGKTGWVELGMNQNRDLISYNLPGGYYYNYKNAPSVACP